jgi:NodT family efflux transporter outer membrane factor (OMF) lipoprotein
MVGSSVAYSRRQPSENGQVGRLRNGPAGLLGIDKLVDDFELYQAGFDASWEIDIFGGVRRSIEVADANAAAAVEEHRDLLITLVAEVARNYIDLRGAQRRMAIAQENLATQRSTLDLVRQKRSVGAVTELDVTRAEAQVSLAESQIPLFTRQIRFSLHALSVLLPQDLDTLSEELHSARPLPVSPQEIPVGLPAELLRRRPDIRRAERTLAAATAQVGVATADLYPRFSLTGTFSMEAMKFAWLGNWDSRTYGFGPSIRWPVFDAGRIRANIRVQDARQEQALARYESVVLGAVREVEDALVTCLTEQTRRRSLADTVESSRQSVELAQLAYDQGATDLLAVLDVERTLYSAQDALAATDQTVVTSVVALYKALGGGWDVAADTQPESDR